MEPSELWQEPKDYRTFQQMGVRGAFLSCQRNGLVVKIKHKSHLLGWSTVSSGDLLAGLVVSGPRVLCG